MMRHPIQRSTKEWIEEHAQELAASGVVDLMRRRAALLLATSVLEGETHSQGEAWDENHLRIGESASARTRLLAAWAEAQAAKAGRSSATESPFRATGH